jgi:glycosyltransferase involved in cell wall biosynthesis
MKRVLFIGHDANRAGAPIILLHFLQWLKENNSLFKADLLLFQSGALEAEYRKAIDVYTLPAGTTKNPFKRGARFLKKKFKLAPGLPKRTPMVRNYDVVVGNTVISLEYLKSFKQKGARTICWLHELEFAVNTFSKEKFLELADYVDCFLVVSRAVENMLRQFGITKEIHLVYGFSTPVAAQVVEAEIETVKNELGIPADAFVVGGSGTVEWRKGTDIFLQIARHLLAARDNFYFVWVGGKSSHSDVEYNLIRHDFERFGLKEKVIFTGLQENPRKFFAAMDLFALTSREDPFPLVCLEAAALEKPIICFENAGGAPEFVETDCGFVVPYLDVEAFADKILALYEDAETRRKFGRRAAQKVRERHNVETAAPKILEVIKKCGNL